MSQISPQLEYVSIRRLQVSDARQKIVREAQGNGKGSIFLGLMFGLFTFGFMLTPRLFGGTWTTLEIMYVWIHVVYSFAFLGGGVLYVLASVHLKTPGCDWEGRLLVSAATHVATIVLMAGATVAMIVLENAVNVLGSISLFINLVAAASFLIMIRHMRELRRTGN